MEVKYILGNKTLQKEIRDDNLGFLLTDGIGGYLALGSAPTSRYQGWFTRINGKLWKIMDNLDVAGENSAVTGLTYHFNFAQRSRGSISEKYLLPEGFSALSYEASKAVVLELILDIRQSYDLPVWGRQYQVSRIQGGLIIKYHYQNDEIYLAVRADAKDFLTSGTWFARYYPQDKMRASPPDECYVYRAAHIECSKLVMAVGSSPQAAIKIAEEVWRQSMKLKSKSRADAMALEFKLASEEIQWANLAAKKSLAGLAVCDQQESIFTTAEKIVGSKMLSSKCSVYAGLPWFFQIWSRDEAISLEALSRLNWPLAETILNRHLANLGEDGRQVNQFGAGGTNADAAAWLFKRVFDWLGEELLDKASIKRIAGDLEKCLAGLLKYKTRDDLALADAQETWMDSLPRSGAPIELQAQRLLMYKLAWRLTNNKFYDDLKRELEMTVRAEFWDGKILADGLADWTIRPNVFLAAYLYPKLLSKEEWAQCFDNILPKLWLSWGGLATIDQTDSRFINSHTGENSASYHNGDSWFYLNNLAALVLHRTDQKRFQKYIDQIIAASTRDILWQGAIGQHSEVSSASKLESSGCFAQAWSAAMYIELIEEVYAGE